MIKKLRIGILGGMGAAAGVHFVDQLVKHCQKSGARGDSDFPEIVLFSLSSDGMNETGITDERVMKRDLFRGIELLNACEVHVVLIACNTVHVYLSWLQKYSKAGIVNIPEEALKMSGTAETAVLCSRTSRETGLYGKNQIYCTEEQQDVVDAIIGRVIAGSEQRGDTEKLQRIIDDLFRKGADRIIIGCTELPAVVPFNPKLIDAGECGIRKALQFNEI